MGDMGFGIFLDTKYGYYSNRWYRVVSRLKDYSWIKSTDHLKRVNRYRRRTSQRQLYFNDDDMFDLEILGE